MSSPTCQECGQPLKSWAQYHPIEACEAYKHKEDIAKGLKELADGKGAVTQARGLEVKKV